jgi:hypothetical protein
VIKQLSRDQATPSEADPDGNQPSGPRTRHVVTRRRLLPALVVAAVALSGPACIAVSARVVLVSLGTPDTSTEVAAQVRHLRDALASDPDPAGAAQGPRASSTVLSVRFEHDVDPVRAARDYAAVSRRFVTREWGWVGVREYPAGTDGAGDVDSGPLVLGISLSATTVAIGAARAAGDRGLALNLEREAELFGMPWTWGPEDVRGRRAARRRGVPGLGTQCAGS